jgi:hypothetical protein
MSAPIPTRLRSRPRDERGLVIPWFAWIDRDGKPHFATNDPTKAARGDTASPVLALGQLPRR